MKKPITIFLITISSFFLGNNQVISQVSNYTFVETSGAYQTIVPDVTLGSWSGTISGSSSNRLTISLPFSFCMGNNTYNSGDPLTMYHDGWAAFGNLNPSTTDRIAPLTNLNNVMSAFGTDLITAGSSTYGARVQGTAPYRVFILQWGGSAMANFWKRAGGGAHSNDRLHFQIRLYETSGMIEFHYLISQASNNNGGTMTSDIHVGLTGSTSGDFNVRTKSGNTIWNGNHSAGSARPSGTSNTMNFNNRAGQSPNQLIKPDGTITPSSVGTIFRWTPQVNGTWDDPDSWVNCYNPLAITLDEFNGKEENRRNKLEWETASETNNDYFIVETSVNGFDWNELDRINGMGSTTKRNNYELFHHNPENIHYYRLKQVDYDGTTTNYGPIIIERKTTQISIVRKTNLLGQEIKDDYRGIVIIQYSDGSNIKTFQ